MRLHLLIALPLGISLAAAPALAQPEASPTPAAGGQTMASPAPMASGMGTMKGPGMMMGSGSQATVTLVPQNGSNETGMATLTETKKGLVVSVTTDTAPDSPQPIHIHKGSCANLDPTPAYPLTMVAKGTNTMGNPKGISTTTLKSVTLAQLESGQYAINVHKSLADAKTYVACGDIKNANPTGTSQ